VVGACQPPDEDGLAGLAAPEGHGADEPATNLAAAEQEPARAVHDDGAPVAASLADGEAVPRRTSDPRSSAEIAASHQNTLREALARSPVRLELPADARWTVEVAPGSEAGAYLVTSAEPLAACGVQGPVKVRVPYHSELDLAVDGARTLLVLGRADADGVESVLAMAWDGRGITSPKSAVPVPLARRDVFGDCPQG
jgi:hypothetical protein